MTVEQKAKLSAYKFKYWSREFVKSRPFDTDIIKHAGEILLFYSR